MKIVKSRTSSYTTQNRLGVYYFQYAIPKAVGQLHPELPKLFRKTLHTRSKREAEKSARRLWCLMDELTRRLILSSPVVAGKATELLMRYKEIEHQDWQIADEFLSSLEDQETEILDTAIDLDKQQSNPILSSITIEKQDASLENSIKELTTAIQTIASNQINISENSSTTANKSENNIEINELLTKFIAFKKDDVTKGTLTSIKSKLQMFLNIVFEISKNNKLLTCELTQELVRNYRDTLKKIPARRNKFSVTTTFEEMISTGGDPISAKTYRDTTSLVSQFLLWAENEGYTIEQNLNRIFKISSKKNNANALKRLNFNDDQLIALFESDQYQKGQFKKPSEYWAPLIALYSGARLGEILQLLCEDIRKVENVWVFDINEEDEKQVKTERSNRLVPIHSTLLNLGFIKFVEHRKHTNSNLFPEEPRSNDGKFSNFSKRYATYCSATITLSGRRQLS
jgi:integrase